MKLTVFLLVSLGLVKALNSKFLELSKYLEELSDPCLILPSESSQKDSFGVYWPTYTYSCTKNPVLFVKSYTQEGWTYYTNKFIGEQRFQNRVVLEIQECPGEISFGGRVWKNWCFVNGKEVEFQKKANEFVVDLEGGYEPTGYRRIVLSWQNLLEEDSSPEEEESPQEEYLEPDTNISFLEFFN